MTGSLVGVALLLAVGIFASAFFSGSETGFYRATRVRLLLDAISGRWTARWMLWLIHRPSLFLATTLIGNNLANYTTSLAIVIGVQLLFGQDLVAGLLAPLVLAPLLFVYGELLPKNLFYQAPNYLLRKTGPLFLVAALVLLPLSMLVWGLNKILQLILGESPQRIQLTLARKELHEVLEEGHEVGILRPAQRILAQGLLAMANRKVVDFSLPVARLASVKQGASKSDALRLAHRHRVSVIPVESPDSSRRLVGYVRVVDLYLQEGDRITEVRPLVEIPDRASHLSAMMQLETADESIARVVDSLGETVGLVTTQQLVDPLFRAG